MEYWEFLIQKEGKRSWQPIKPPKMELEAGRYRVVAHSSRKNTDVEICVTHTSTEEAPPKRRSQKRSRRTNREGLMVVIPFTHLKPGVWELRCCGDILSDFLGTSWQESVQVNVVPQAINVEPVDEPTSPVIDATCTEVQADVSEILSNTDSDPVVAVPFIEDECEKRIGEEDENGKSNAGIPPFPAHPIPEVSNPPFQENEQLPATVADIAISSELVELDEEPVASTNNLDEGARAANPLLDQSLQALEQILQQVLDPVLQDFERAETPEPETETPESEVSSEIESDRQGLTLSLDEDTFVVRRGESLTIPGRLTLSDVNQVNGNETSSVLNDCFQGSLRYELRDPQTSQLLLDVQHPLPQQALPLTFSHSLEIPAECNTRLILGKVTLYGLTSRALTSQPFTVTADLDELLGAIIPGSKVMPVAKMLVLANNPEAFQDFQEEGSEAADLTLDGALLDLVNIPRNPQPLPLQPISQKPLPPQLYQPTPTQKSSKSLQLPDFPKVQPVAASAASLANLNGSQPIEFKQKETAGPSEDTEQESQSQDAVQPLENAAEEDTVLVEDLSSIAWDATEWSDFTVSVVEPGLNPAEATPSEIATPAENTTLQETPTLHEPSDALESTPDHGMGTANGADTLANATTAAEQPLSESEVQEVLDATNEEKEESQPTEVSVNGSVAEDSTAVDNAFQSLNLQDRFWLRLNSLVADAELSEWLKSELLLSSNSTEVEEVTPSLELETGIVEVEDVTPSLEPDTGIVEVEDVTQSFDSEGGLADFDESLWEESEEFGDESTEAEPLQPPPLDETTFPEEEIPAQAQNFAPKDWAEEIVVDDEELPAAQQPLDTHQASRVVYPTEQVSSQPEPRIPYSPELELPLPAPTIFIPTNELAAGEPVTIRIKLPPHPARLCVKLWIQDRQSRSLLDGPRWLVDLIPDGAGQMEAMTQLIVPFGSVEIRFEAIAVDIYTQRESHKVTVDCVVVPPDLPNISLDDFED